MTLPKLIYYVDRGDIARAPTAKLFTIQKLKEGNLTEFYRVQSGCTQGFALDDSERVEFPNITYYKAHYNQSKTWLENHNIDLTSHWQTSINNWVIEKADVVFAMDRKVLKSLLIMYPDYEEKTHLFSEIIGDQTEIIDPDTQPKEQIVQILETIKNTIEKGFPRLLTLAEGTKPTNLETLDRMKINNPSYRERK